MSKTNNLLFTRRQMITGGSATLIGFLFFTKHGYALSSLPLERSLHLVCKRTGESFKGPYWNHGHYLPNALKKINFLMRDKNNHKIISIDLRILELMHVLQQKIRSSHPLEIICGFRSLETNNYLREVSHGVAKNSLHLLGRAVDIRMKGISLSQLRDTAQSLKVGGVGYYPRSNYIHIDVRPQPYYW